MTIRDRLENFAEEVKTWHDVSKTPEERQHAEVLAKESFTALLNDFDRLDKVQTPLALLRERLVTFRDCYLAGDIEMDLLHDLVAAFDGKTTRAERQLKEFRDIVAVKIRQAEAAAAKRKARA